jgi:tripartite ATP-independent transporter DctM subunit
MSVFVALLVLLITMVIGVPIPFAFLASSAYLVFVGGYDPGFLIPYGYSKMNSIILLTIPLFIMAGSIMDKGGIGKRLVDSIEQHVGQLKGGLGVVTVVASALFGAVSGSSSATLSAIGTTMAPRLKENGYSPGLTASLIASSGVLGILIPPSMLMILYSWIANVSVLAAFLAATGPGILLVILLSVINLIMAKNNPNIKVLTKEDVKRFRRKEKVSSDGKRVWGVGPALLMPIIILGSIYGGILTPTEAAAVSVFYALPVGMFIYKQLDTKTLKETLIQSSITTGVIMIMLFAVMILSRLYIMENLPQTILATLTSISDNKIVILMMINVFMIILGMLMDDVSGVLLATPILLPVVTSIGIDPVHFAAIVGVNLGMGNVTPPTAPLLYLAGRISKAEVKDMLKPTMILIIFAWIPTLIITTYFPQVALYLPRLILGLS